MKIGFICKYPPITGGVASRTYWLTRALADRGHHVHVMTNSTEIELRFRQSFTPEDDAVLRNRENLFLHTTTTEGIPPIRPAYNPFDIKLANLALKVIRDYKLDILDSWFLIPNSVAAFMVKQLTGIPWVLRHGGSDLGEHLVSPHFDEVLKRILFKADKIITHSSNKDVFAHIGIPAEKLWMTIYSLVNRRFFNPQVKAAEGIARGKPVILCIGKIGKKKGTFDLLKAFLPLKEKADLVFVTGGPGLDKFRERIRELELEAAVRIFPPVPPWQVPGCIRAATCLVHMEREFGIPHYPIIPREILACGRSLLLSEEMFKKYPGLVKGETVLVTDPRAHDRLTALLGELLENTKLRQQLEAGAAAYSERYDKYDDYIKNVEVFYSKLI